MKTMNYDIVIIGGGPAGMAAAVEVAENGKESVLLIERDKSLGGILQQCIHGVDNILVGIAFIYFAAVHQFAWSVPYNHNLHAIVGKVNHPLCHIRRYSIFIVDDNRFIGWTVFI